MGGPRKDKRGHGGEVIGLGILEHGNTKWKERDAFAVWLLTPKQDREHKTQRALAKHLKIDEMSLVNWKRDKMFMRRVYHKAGIAARIEWLPEIMEHQFEVSTSPSARPGETTAAAKFIVGVMEKAMELDEIIEATDATPIEKMTLAELEAAMNEHLDAMRDQIERTA